MAPACDYLLGDGIATQIQYSIGLDLRRHAGYYVGCSFGDQSAINVVNYLCCRAAFSTITKLSHVAAVTNDSEFDLFTSFSDFWVQFIVGTAKFDVSLFLPAISSLIIWPWVFWILRRIRRLYKVR